MIKISDFMPVAFLEKMNVKFNMNHAMLIARFRHEFRANGNLSRRSSFFVWF